MTGYEARVADLSELERAALGFQEDPFVEGQWVAPDGTVFQPGHVVAPPQVVHDEKIVQLGPLVPLLPTRWHKTGKLWRPQWLTVRVDPVGEIEFIRLGGPVVRLDTHEPYADGSWEHIGWWVGYRVAMSPSSNVWPEGAPEFAVATVRWLIDSRPYLHLPETG